MTTRLGYWFVALIASALALLGWWQRAHISLLERVDSLSLDAQMQWRGPIQPRLPILIVTIDEASAMRGGTPDRRALSAALDRLSKAGARLVALDILLLDAGDAATDVLLAASIKRSGRVLLPYALGEEPGPDGSNSRAVLDSAWPKVEGDMAKAATPLRARRLLAPLPLFADAALGLGNVGAVRSSDGALRFDLPALALSGEVYPTLALRVAAQLRGADWQQAWLRPGQEAAAGTLRVPLDALSRQWLNYYGPGGTFERLSFAELLKGGVPDARLKDRIVLIGTTALGSGDAFPTPFDSGLPGVERLATAIDNLIGERVLRRPDWAAPTEIALMLVLPLLVIGLLSRWRLRVALPVLFLVAVVLLLLLQRRFELQHEFIAPAFPLLAAGLAVLGALALRAADEHQRRKAALLALRESEQRYALAAEGANDGLWDWDLEAGTVHYSPRWLALMGLDAAEAADIKAWTRPLPPAAGAEFERALDEHLQGRSRQLHHLLEFEQGGQHRWLLARGMATREQGRAVRMAGSLTDVSELHRLQQQISHDALHDRLTGLPNRALFRVQLEAAMAEGDAGLVLLGLDEFRAFNEAQGLAAGDAVLVETGQRLRQREGQVLMTGRLGPDEFGIVFRARHGDNDGLVAWVLDRFEQPYALPEGGVQKLTACVGWAQAAEGPATADELIAAAEGALARAKMQGPGSRHCYDPAEQLVERSRRWMREQIDVALAERGQFKLFYQPFIRLSDRQLLGFEALIRWHHPQRGLVMPGDFIPVAEASGQIAEIGRWTLMEAAAQLRRWQPLGFTGEIAVNVSGVQLERDQELLADAHAALKALGDVPPRQLKLEVTESMAMANPTRSAEVLRELASLGFKLSIDDFGTGYSSLAYLHRFPFDTLKIDRSFVMRLEAGREAVEIVRTIVGLANALGKQTLAEGVEDEAQAAQLTELGVQVGQGWLFAKALPESEAERWIGRPTESR